MDKVLLAYATKHGSTLEVAEAVDAVLRRSGVSVALREAARVEDVGDFRAVVLGAPIYMMRWHRAALRFLRRHAQALDGRPLAVFALGPLHEDEDEWAKARGIVSTALAARAVDPVAVEIFGGRVSPGDLHFPLSRMPAEDARDWTAIEAWAASLPPLLVPPAPA